MQSPKYKITAYSNKILLNGEYTTEELIGLLQLFREFGFKYMSGNCNTQEENGLVLYRNKGYGPDDI